MAADFQLLFDNYDLNTIAYLEFTRRFPNNEADLDITSHELVRRSGSVLTSTRHKDKIIALEGIITAPTRTSYEETMDELKYRTSAIERPLVLIQAGSMRSYVATKENIVEEHIERGNSRVNLAFRCSDPFGKSGDTTEESFVITTASSSIAHTFLGTAPLMPIITVTVGSLTGGTAKYIGIGNSSTGQQVQVTRTWTAADVVQFDLANKRVFVNAVETDYDGVFPFFYPNTTTATYADDLTTRSVTVKVQYVRQYL